MEENASGESNSRPRPCSNSSNREKKGLPQASERQGKVEKRRPNHTAPRNYPEPPSNLER
eukprot:946482-Rhodomonas_salina.2